MDKAYALYVDAKKARGDPQSMSTSILDKPSDALMGMWACKRICGFGLF